MKNTFPTQTDARTKSTKTDASLASRELGDVSFRNDHRKVIFYDLATGENE
jgi:hypothetical protein